MSVNNTKLVVGFAKSYSSSDSRFYTKSGIETCFKAPTL